MKRHQLRILTAALLAVLVPAAQAAPFAGFVAGGGFDVGGQKVMTTGAESKFNEYRDVKDGFLVNQFDVKAYKEDNPYFFEFRGVNATRRDEGYRIEAGKVGRFKAVATFDRIVHNFGEGRLLQAGAGSGVLGIDNTVQGALQAVEQNRDERDGVSGLPGPNPVTTTVDPNTDFTGEDAAQQGIIRDLLANTDPLRFALDREKGSLALEFNTSANGKTWVKVVDERRHGFRQIGWGTYERYAQGTTAGGNLAHTEDKFMTGGQQLAEPVRYRTTSLNAGTGIYRRDWSADLEYTYTQFENRFSALRWSNPFRSTDAPADNGDGTTANGGAASNAFDRGRFTEEQLSLPPSSQSHELAASGSVELPLHSRFSAALGLGVNEQNEPLLPYTLNTALSGAAGGGGPANINSTSALPVQRFNGSVRNLSGSFALASKPVDHLSTKLKYRYYDYDNRSDTIYFPGYAAFSTSFWRAVKNDKNAKVYNERLGYTRQTADLGVGYELAEPLEVDVDGTWDRWSFRNNRVQKLNELGGGAGLTFRGGRWVKVHGGVHYARRTTEGYQLGNTSLNPEAQGLVNFNWAERNRQRYNLGFDVTPNDKLSFGVTSAFRKDELGGGERFGLKEQTAALIGLNATAEPCDAFTLSVDYSRERLESKMQNGAKDDVFNSASSVDDPFRDNFNPLNWWHDKITEDVDTISVDATARPTDKIELGTGYSFAYSRMGFDATNPNAAALAADGITRGAKLINGVAQAWPKVTGRTHEVRAGAAYKLTPDVRVGLSYLFEKYDLEDFANTGAYLSGATPENTTRYVWTGSSQFSYLAHVVGTYVAMRF